MDSPPSAQKVLDDALAWLVDKNFANVTFLEGLWFPAMASRRGSGSGAAAAPTSGAAAASPAGAASTPAVDTLPVWRLSEWFATNAALQQAHLNAAGPTREAAAAPPAVAAAASDIDNPPLEVPAWRGGLGMVRPPGMPAFMPPEADECAPTATAAEEREALVPNAEAPPLPSGCASGAADPARQEWWYLDRTSQEYGPFGADTMRAWFDQGFFPFLGELPVRQAGWLRHFPMQLIYPDMTAIFIGSPPPPEVALAGDEAGSDPPPAGALDIGQAAASVEVKEEAAPDVVSDPTTAVGVGTAGLAVKLEEEVAGPRGKRIEWAPPGTARSSGEARGTRSAAWLWDCERLALCSKAAPPRPVNRGYSTGVASGGTGGTAAAVSGRHHRRRALAVPGGVAAPALTSPAGAESDDARLGAARAALKGREVSRPPVDRAHDADIGVIAAAAHDGREGADATPAEATTSSAYAGVPAAEPRSTGQLSGAARRLIRARRTALGLREPRVGELGRTAIVESAKLMGKLGLVARRGEVWQTIRLVEGPAGAASSSGGGRRHDGGRSDTNRDDRPACDSKKPRGQSTSAGKELPKPGGARKRPGDGGDSSS